MMGLSIFGGFVTERFGGKFPLFVVIFLVGVLTFITPFLVKVHWAVFCAKQIVEGAATGSMFPLIYYLLGKWIHPCERNSLGSLSLAGPYIGVIFAMIINGFIATSSLGWPGIFYVSGLICIIWSILWLIYGGDSPVTYKQLGIDEKQFLESIPGKTKENLKTPWRNIWMSKSVWGYIFAQCGLNWGFVFILTSTPTYFNDVHQINLKAVSYILISLIFSGNFSKNIASLTECIIFFNAIYTDYVDDTDYESTG